MRPVRAVAFAAVLLGAGDAVAGEAPVAPRSLVAPKKTPSGPRGLGPPPPRGAGEGAVAQGSEAAGPQPAGEPIAAGSLEVSAQLWAVIARYRFGATADRVRMTVAQANGRSDMHTLIIRCVPGAAGLARLELNDITLVAAQGVLRAVHERDPTTYVEIPGPDADADPAAVLRALLPPLAIPQISLAFDPGDVEWCPLVSGIAWESAERIERDGNVGVRLTGRSSAGRASLDLAAGRVRRFEADLGQGSQGLGGEGSGASIIIEAEPLEPDDPAGWGLHVGGRRRVERLGLLRALGAPISIGDRWPSVQTTLAGTGDTIEWPPIARDGAGAASDLWALAVLGEEQSAEEAGEIAELALGAVVLARREMLRGRLDGRYDKRLGLRGVLGAALVDQEAGTFEEVERLRAAWEGAVDSAWPRESERPAFAWAPAETRLMDRLAFGSGCVVVLIDGRGTVLALAPVGRDAPPEEISRALVAGLPELPGR